MEGEEVDASPCLNPQTSHSRKSVIEFGENASKGEAPGASPVHFFFKM